MSAREEDGDRRLAEMARKLAIAWATRNRLRRERKGDRCTLATWSDEPDEGPEVGGHSVVPSDRGQVPPCWKNYQETSEGHLAPLTLCEACRRNGDRRAKERAAAAQIAGLISTLSRLGRRWIEEAEEGSNA